ncbi:hypothetical protein ACM25N_06740 [Roseovarius sp. C7]|uniref:hypothetical protein n=1 Tax=Roseovarius sp. C7 TaxID=3398643 RepID=UPI0039F6AA21
MAAPLSAGMIVDNPGFCDATGGEQELADLVTLEPEGMFSHSLRCVWLDGPQRYEPGRIVRHLKAECDDGGRQWQAAFSVSVNEQLRVNVVSHDGVGLPEYYFDCASWGWKGWDVQQSHGRDR